MDYQRKLIIAKSIVSVTAVLAAWPLVVGDPVDRAVVVWTISLPVFAFLLWGNLHGTGRSVRIMSLLGLTYSISFLILGMGTGPFLPSLLAFGFTLGFLMSIKLRSSSKQDSVTA